MRRIRNACSACLVLAPLLGIATSAHAIIEFSSGFNFRSTRYDEPLHFRSGSDALIFGGTILDSNTGQAPAGAIVQAINSNSKTGSTQPFRIDLSGGSNGEFSRVIDYDPQLAAGTWEVVVASDVGSPSGFILSAFGTGAGTGPIPDVVDNLTVTQSAGNPPVMNWDVPANLGTLNDGNVDRQRIRLRDSTGPIIFDEPLPTGSSLATETFTLPDPTHDGLYQTAVLVEGFTPFLRSETYASYVVDGVGVGGQPIDIESTFLLRDNRQVNSVNFGLGDSITVGVNVDASGPNNTDPFNTFAYAQQGSQMLALTRANDLPTEFASSFDFDASMTGSWDIHLDNGEHDATTFTGFTGGAGDTPQGLGAAPSLGFVNNLTITTGAGAPPRLDWALPAGSTHDRVAIGLFDDVTNFRIPLGDTGGLFQNLDAAATSFEFAADFFGPGGLDPNGKYAARVILNDDIAPGVTSRSLSFVNFTPSLDTGGLPVFIPTVDETGVFHFDIDVGELQVIPLDPFVAIGYVYEIGAGDPNFASVELPVVGSDDEFLLEFVDALGVLQQLSLLAGDVFEFRHPDTSALVGVDSFTVSGIDPAVGLDPGDVTAFVTNVQFVTAGRFTGTMTPITLFVAAAVSEPPTALLLGLGVLGALGLRRRRGSAPS